MNWWQETEARAHRTRTPGDMAHLLWQRFCEAGLDPDLSFTPAHQIAAFAQASAEFIKLTEALLVAKDGDRRAIHRSLAAIDGWASHLQFWIERSEKPFARLLDSLNLDADLLAAREEGLDTSTPRPPQEQAKVDGRYRNWHLLYERLDLKLASTEADAGVARSLAREIAEIYEECLAALRDTERLEKDARARFRNAARLILDLNTGFHFHLGPHHLGYGAIDLKGGAVPSLRSWILLYITAAWPSSGKP